jgi:hypothetical protein
MTCMAETKQKAPSKYRWILWGGLALWLTSAVLYANVGPFKSITLQWLGIAGFLLFAYGLIQTLRHRKRTTSN